MTPNLTKLAPSLSAEERYKIVMSDMLAQQDGEPAKLSESEMKAMIWFESKSMWQEYAFHAAMMRHATEIWVIEIETEKLRSYAYYLHLSHQLERVVTDIDAPKAKKAERFKGLKQSTVDLHHAIEGFYAYREAITKLEAILYGVPFFSETMRASLDSQFDNIGDIVRNYNGMLRDICACYDAKKFIKPIVEDIDSYLVKNAVPSDAAVNKLVDFIQHLAESEMRARN
jgi:hypothetical protein